MDKTTVLNRDDLAEIIANSLPISSEDARDLVESISKGYASEKVSYLVALGVRDRAISNLMRQNDWLRTQNRKLRGFNMFV